MTIIGIQNKNGILESLVVRADNVRASNPVSTGFCDQRRRGRDGTIRRVVPAASDRRRLANRPVACSGSVPRSQSANGWRILQEPAGRTEVRRPGLALG